MKMKLIKLADHLDRIGLVREANYLDDIIKKSKRRRLFRKFMPEFAKQIFKMPEFVEFLDKNYPDILNLPFFIGISEPDKVREFINNSSISENILADIEMYNQWMEDFVSEIPEGNLEVSKSSLFESLVKDIEMSEIAYDDNKESLDALKDNGLIKWYSIEHVLNLSENKNDLSFENIFGGTEYVNPQGSWLNS